MSYLISDNDRLAFVLWGFRALYVKQAFAGDYRSKDFSSSTETVFLTCAAVELRLPMVFGPQII